jgi:predicted Fe-Mo cluster-binding NifX family protein
MKIAISASSPELSSSVDPKFGRSLYFIFIDPDTMEYESVENPNVRYASGAGIQTAQFVAGKGVQAVLTGSCGPNAFQTLQAAGVQVLVGITGTIQEAVEQYKSGRFKVSAGSNVPPHFGMPAGGSTNAGFGSGGGRGGGMSRGMGGGMGRGRGGGMGYRPPSQPFPEPSFNPPRPNMSPKDEVEYLKQQAGVLKSQIEAIYRRIEEIGENKK